MDFSATFLFMLSGFTVHKASTIPDYHLHLIQSQLVTDNCSLVFFQLKMYNKNIPVTAIVEELRFGLFKKN